MADIEIDLSSYNDRFVTDSKLKLSKNVNFIFGKNGTGKTTIVEAIKNQYATNYDVHIFNGYEGIVGENHQLDAIALGTENTEIQKEIEKVDQDINCIQKEVEENSLEENIAINEALAKKEHDKQNTKIQTFFTDSASEIKNLSNPQVAKATYTKNDFENEIAQAKFLSDDEIKKFQTLLKEDRKLNIEKGFFSVTTSNLAKYLARTNELLGKKVSLQAKISELDNNNKKQNFAKEGLQIHDHKNGENCSFCGNEISEERRKLLEGYFNIGVSNLETDIENLISAINTDGEILDKINTIDKDIFYLQFSEQIENCNIQIEKLKNEHKLFIKDLVSVLEEKKKSLFSETQSLTLEIPNNFSAIKQILNNLMEENNKISNDLENQKDTAKNSLRYHEIKKALEVFSYEAENQRLKDLDEIKKKAEKELNDKKTELRTKQEERKKLVEQTKDESKLATMISNCLKSTGIESFSLELISEGEERGQYKVKGHNSEFRSVKELSDGEKNITAFLYFIFKLQSSEIQSSKPKFVIFDDPMTSNDDTMQYLMTTKIHNLYKYLPDTDKFILLTHNIHFYLNVRPYYNPAEDNHIKERNKKLEEYQKKEKLYHEKNNYFKLESDKKLTTIKQITLASEDFKSNYHALWDDLVYLYNSDKPLSMINNCRRILETYIKFNCYNPNVFYKDNEEAQKLFNVNSHCIDDLENESNAKTKNQIKDLLKGIFENNNIVAHFDSYFPE